MYHKRYIIPGVLAFLLLFSGPFWGGLLSREYTRPVLPLPIGEDECVESVSYMRAQHMRLLNEWRDAAMREGKRLYQSGTGKLWTVSLQNTCMRCHSDTAAFCDTCHIPNSVTPYCWSCHLESKRIAASGGKP
jgi:hypothetical protein